MDDLIKIEGYTDKSIAWCNDHYISHRAINDETGQEVEFLMELKESKNHYLFDSAIVMGMLIKESKFNT